MKRSLLKIFPLSLIVSLMSVLGAQASQFQTVFIKNSKLPLTVFNLTFRVGSADDPAGSEGLAALTAKLMREGGVQAWEKFPARSREQIEDFLFPLAAEVHVHVDKEQTSFQVTTSAQDAEPVLGLLIQMILSPAWDAGEFERLRAETLDFLEKQAPREDQEELGKAVLNQQIYGKSHPYGHIEEGTVKSIRALTVGKIKEFHHALFTQRRLTIGLAGVVPPSLEALARHAFSKLPPGAVSRTPIPQAPKRDGLRLTLVKGPFSGVGVHLGHPLDLTRADPEFPEMVLAAQAFGKHRSFVGRLMKVVREIRGLNYGTYAYVENFPFGGMLLEEPTQVARSRQAFTVWGRPTTLENGCFLLRQLYRETSALASQGLKPQEFSLTRGHLAGSAPLLAMSLERQLGYAIDSKFYGIRGDYLAHLRKAALHAKLPKVNRLVKNHIKPESLEIVVVTPDPESFKAQILSQACSVHYAPGVTMPPEILAEDQLISKSKLPLDARAISTLESEQVFQE